MAIDDTLARKRGLKIFGVGMHHDPLLSSRKTAVMNWGHNWVILGVIVTFPFCTRRYFRLPNNCDLTPRLTLDVRLYDAAPPRKPGTRGRALQRAA